MPSLESGRGGYTLISMNLFYLIFYQPLLNVLILLYQYLPGQDFGVAIIFLTILIRILFYPLTSQTIKSQKALEDFQSKVREIQEKYKKNKEEQAKAMMEFYQKEKVNPFSGCLPLLIQLPILIALYQVFQKGLAIEEMTNLYSFVPQPTQINPFFLGILNLIQPNLVLAILAGIFQFLQTKMTIPKNSKTERKEIPMARFSQMMQKQMLYFFPFFTFLFLWRLPAAIALYWLVTTLLSIIQQYLIFKPRTKASLGTGQEI